MADGTRLRDDAAAIRDAAIGSVQPERLAVDAAGRVLCDGGPLDPPLSLADVDRIVVVGGGKAAAGLAAGVERLLGGHPSAGRGLSGLVSVPEGCGRTLERIEVRETRPASANLPTPAVVRATREMLDLVRSLGPRDLVVAVVTGGGSALLAAPRDGVTLDDKIALTSRLSEAGADIATLNAARRKMSRVKGGGLARACTAGRLVVLAISDVVGDDLDVIASGPCMPSERTSLAGTWTTPAGCHVEHIIVGDNATAIAAAAAAARLVGYEVVPAGICSAGTAEAVGRRLLARGRDLAAAARRDGRPRAWIEGGEATVVVPADHGHGGRNQQTVLAALAAADEWPEGMVLASIATDGEDGPTDAAGAIADGHVAAVVDGAVARHGLERCDAYRVLDAAGALVRTGPTGTNVADLRVVLVRPGGRSP